MLVDCPKCGFIQPKDRYCASCGIDMSAFHPKEPSFISQIFGNPISFIFIVIVLVFTAIVFIRKQRLDEIKSRMAYLQSGPIVVDRQDLMVETTTSIVPAAPPEAASTLTTLPTTNTTITTATTVVVPSSLQGGSTIATANTASAATASSPLESGSKNARSQFEKPTESGIKKTHVKMAVYLTELPKGEIKKIEEWALQGGGQWQHFDDVYWGVVPGLGRRMKELAGITIFERTEKLIDLQNNSIQWFNGSRHKSGETELDMGLNFYLVIDETAEHNLKVSIEAQRALREGSSPQVVRKSFSFNFEIKGDSGFIASGLLPRKFDFDGDDEYSWDSFLKVFKSNSYLANQSDFALLFEFDASK